MNSFSEALEDLGISRRCLEFLRMQNIQNVSTLLSTPAEQLLRRPIFSREIGGALSRLKVPAADAMAEVLSNAPSAAPKLPSSETPLQCSLGILRRRLEPITLKRLKDEVHRALGAGNLSLLRAELQAHEAVIFYPFGSHQWVGLRDWGDSQLRAAAKGAWSVLPVHLEQLIASDRKNELDPNSRRVLAELARESNHVDLIRLLAVWAEPVALPELTSVPEALIVPTCPLDLFAGCKTTDSLLKLAEPVVTKSKLFSKPFSLCQLQMNETDFNWLRLWASSLRGQVVFDALESRAPAFVVGGTRASILDCFGLLVMLLASEVARREAREGQVWNVIHPCFSVSSRSLLFVGGQPRAPLREALELACRRFRLHHAFSVDGAQAWYQSIFLQFGFTRHGIKKLPLWLSVPEAQTVAIQTLLEGSNTFRALWQALLSYRKLRSTSAREALKSELQANPYVLLEWSTLLMQAAVEAGPEVTNHSEVDGELSYPRLSWPVGESPRFSVSPGTLGGDLSESGYCLVYGDEQLARLYLESEGYVSDPGEVEFPPRQDSYHLSLVGDDGDVREFELQLWDSEALFCMYRLDSGERLASLAVGKTCALLLADSIQVVPASDEVFRCGRTGFALHRFSGGLNSDHRLFAGGQELAGLTEETEPSWTKEIYLRRIGNEAVTLPSRVTVELYVKSGVQFRWARFGRQPVAMKPVMAGFRGEVLVEPDLPSSLLRLHFGLEYEGRKVRVTRSCAISVRSVTALLDGSWTVLANRPSLKVSEGRESSFRFFTGGDPHKDYALLEGDIFSARPRAGTRKLGRLAGFGAALRLQRGPFNASDDGYLLAQEVSDRRYLRRHKIEGGQFSLEFNRSLEGDEDHQVVWWDGQNQPVLQRAEELDVVTGSSWRGPYLCGPGACAVGLAYQGVWQGCDWPSGFLLSSETTRPGLTAGMLRWLHLPIVSKSMLERVRRLATSHPVEFLLAWLVKPTVEHCEALQFEAELSEWNHAVCEVFRGWTPTPEQAAQILEDIPYHTLLAVSPFLLFRLARHGLDSVRKEELLLQLTDCPTKQIRNKLLEFEAEAARSMQVNTGFVGSLVKTVEDPKSPLSDRDRLNLNLACGIDSFRRLMAAKLLLKEINCRD